MYYILYFSHISLLLSFACTFRCNTTKSQMTRCMKITTSYVNCKRIANCNSPLNNGSKPLWPGKTITAQSCERALMG